MLKVGYFLWEKYESLAHEIDLAEPEEDTDSVK